MHILSLLAVLAVVNGAASLGFDKRDAPAWSLSSCNLNLLGSGRPQAPMECAFTSVPLDYADPSKGNIKLQMARIPASVQPSRGGIFINPGGPGASGTQVIVFESQDLQAAWGKDWDLIGWDPRAVGNSEPILSHPTYDEMLPIWNSTIHTGQFSAHGNLTNQNDVDFFMAQAPAVDTALQKWNQLLVDRNGVNLTYIGTTANVRDIVTMSDALYGRDQDINFYGISYGTFMGMILTQMFPNRIGKVILDGVMNPQAMAEYLPILNLDEMTADTESELQGLFQACAIAGPSECPLAANYSTVEKIQGAFQQYTDNVYKTWPSTTTVESYTQVINIRTRTYLYVPDLFNIVTTGLASALSAQPTTDNHPAPKQIDYLYAGNYTTPMIFCSDTIDPDINVVTTERVFKEVARVSQTVSRNFASAIMAEHFCHRYTPRAVERYRGPWNVQPKNVVLVIGNQADPVTPFRNAQLVASLLGGKARLVQQAAFGHSSRALPSNCTDNLIAKYLQGTIPEDKGDDGPDVFCPVDKLPFNLPPTTQFNITTSKQGDALTAGASDPGLVNFPGLGMASASQGYETMNRSVWAFTVMICALWVLI